MTRTANVLPGAFADRVLPIGGFDGGFATPANAQGRIVVWTVGDGREVHKELEPAPVTALSYGAGNRFAWASWELKVFENEVNAKGLLKISRPDLATEVLEDHRDIIRGVAFSPSGSH